MSLGRRTADAPGSAGEAPRKRVAELETDKVARDKQLAVQDERIARLETDLGRIAASVSDLRKHDEQQPKAEIAHRAAGGQADRAERADPQHRRRLPSDTVNNAISLVTGGIITELAYHVRDLPPEYAGVGASGLAISAGIVAVWRERRKAKDDADHRPEG